MSIIIFRSVIIIMLQFFRPGKIPLLVVAAAIVDLFLIFWSFFSKELLRLLKQNTIVHLNGFEFHFL